MTRTTKVLVGTALALTVGAGAQVAAYQANPSPTTVHASWSFTPKNADELRARAQSIVLARVQSVSAGPDIVTPQAGEPDGLDRIPTRRVTVEVLKQYKGAGTPGQTLTLFQTGGTVEPAAPAKGTKNAMTKVQQVVLEGDPAYRAGEEYLFMLEAGPQGTLRPVSPEGRYRHDPRTDALTAVAQNPVAADVASNRLAALEPKLKQR